MTKLCFIAAMMMATAMAASAQQIDSGSGVGAGNIGVQPVYQGGRAQDDDERRAQGDFGVAKLAQDSSRSDSDIREALRDTTIEGDEDQSVVTNRSRNDRAAWAADLR
jgi:hypothetical protein